MTYPSLSAISHLSDVELEQLADRLEDDEHPDATVAALHVEREQDARELWRHEDARVRESVGNYR